MTLLDLEDKFIQMINTYNNLENLDINFACDTKVTHNDVHLLLLMSKNPEKKVTELADKFGVTKGAISQQIKKMEKRGLLKRVQYDDNCKEVYIQLTDLAKEAIATHNKIESLVLGNLKELYNGIGSSSKELIAKVLDELILGFKDAEKILKDSYL
ncbi:MAG: MarR family transcriptional regulator [Spirochaetales bacterium]|nr:MarR family transcriptional regulator [Spirochaetales bacterium]